MGTRRQEDKEIVSSILYLQGSKVFKLGDEAVDVLYFAATLSRRWFCGG